VGAKKLPNPKCGFSNFLDRYENHLMDILTAVLRNIHSKNNQGSHNKDPE
jgi:hypothetical protein